MDIRLTPRFTTADIKAMVQQKTQRVEAAILSRLQFVGETFVNNARNNGAYKDRTGNLRSSIGYVILKDGEPIADNYNAVSGGPQGESKAREVIDEAIPNFPKGYVLIVVAGMQYAAAVESKGFDVLTTSAIEAEKDLRDSLNELKTKLTR